MNQRTRFAVLRRDNHTCRYCGDSAPNVVLEIDHIIPISRGGGDEPENLVTACKPCKNGKYATTPDTPLALEADGAATALAAAIQAAAAEAQERLNNHATREQSILNACTPLWGERIDSLPPQWVDIVMDYEDMGLPPALIKDAIRTSLDATPTGATFNAFMNTCNGHIKSIVRRAYQIIRENA